MRPGRVRRTLSLTRFLLSSLLSFPPSLPRTMPYSVDEMEHILSIRAQAESIEVEDEALSALGEIGARSLRYGRREGGQEKDRSYICGAARVEDPKDDSEGMLSSNIRG